MGLYADTCYICGSYTTFLCAQCNRSTCLYPHMHRRENHQEWMRICVNCATDIDTEPTTSPVAQARKISPMNTVPKYLEDVLRTLKDYSVEYPSWKQSVGRVAEAFERLAIQRVQDIAALSEEEQEALCDQGETQQGWQALAKYTLLVRIGLNREPVLEYI
jgi:hypothetical protein